MNNSLILIEYTQPLRVAEIANRLYFHLAQVDPMILDSLVTNVERVASAPPGEDVWLDGEGGRNGVAQRAVSRLLYAIIGLPAEDVAFAVTYAEALALMHGAIDVPDTVESYS